MLEILHPVEARHEADPQRVEANSEPAVSGHELVQGVGEDARPRELESVRGFRPRREVVLGLELGDNPLERVEHKWMTLRRQHDAVAPLRQPHQVSQPEVQRNEADTPRDHAGHPVKKRQRLGKDDTRRGLHQRSDRGMGVHVDVRVDASLKPQDGVAPHVGSLHVGLERVVHAQQSGITRHVHHTDDVPARLCIVGRPNPEAEPDPRGPPLELFLR
mmetsp:Transcript_26087/g.71868  ORF Transcript_26087/g.71868 Transcript_26087/m.71868 type:complete len:217 (+) Transcript_26087:719-1369(+)